MVEDNKFEQAKGNIKETVGNATDNKNLEQEGKEDKTSGKAKEVVDNAKEKANDVIDNLKATNKFVFTFRKPSGTESYVRVLLC